MKKRKRTASLMKLEDPKFLSMVTNPANKTGFKIIRSADAAESTEAALLRIDFPQGITQIDAQEIARIMGLEDEYNLRGDEADGFYLVRKGDENSEIPEDATELNLGNGFSAYATMDVARGDDALNGVQLVRMEFNKDYSVDDVKDWLKEKEIDFQPNGVDVAEYGTVVIRHESKGDEQTVQIMPGVVGYVSRSAETDVPASISREVVEQAYGNYGWGHLTFASAMADIEFTNKSWDAISVLREVLEQIVINSGLPLDERKTLIRSACSQYANYMSGVLDVLPTGVIEQMRNDRNQTRETENMPKEVKDKAEGKAQEVARSDEQKTDKATEANADDSTADDQGDKAPEYVTRGDVETIVTDAVAAAFKAQADKEKVERSDGEDKGTDKEADPVLETLKSFGETLKGISEKVERMSESHDNLKGEVDELAGTTVARSDEDDSSPDEAAVAAQRSDNSSPFNGMFGQKPFDL